MGNTDNVTRPAHYNAGSIECIDAIRAALGPDDFRAYCIGNVIKYNWRYRFKNGPEDLRKAEVYQRWAIEAAPQTDMTKWGPPVDAPERVTLRDAAAAGLAPSPEYQKAFAKGLVGVDSWEAAADMLRQEALARRIREDRTAPELAYADGITADGSGVMPHAVAEALIRAQRDDDGAPAEPPRDGMEHAP